VGLADRMTARPPTLSGGEKQRLAIARAVIGKPDLLLADEPTGNVDPEMAERLMHLFIELNKLGTTTLIASHDMALIEQIGAPQMRLDRGELTLLPSPGGRA
ncbi:MAG TPA: ATP-binding cassette domain-containing protein, partial [Sphingomonadales bacterium]